MTGWLTGWRGGGCGGGGGGCWLDSAGGWPGSVLLFRAQAQIHRPLKQVNAYINKKQYLTVLNENLF